jgi:uncharacterized membrane protein YbhN (UPF0104 family)
LLIGLIFAAAAGLLYHELSQYSLSEIREGIDLLSFRRIGLAAMLTVLSYVVLVGYDWLAVRSIGHALPLRRIALASFCGHAASYNFGALLGGSSIRCRFYAAWGLSAVEIVQLLAMLGVTFWLGAFALAGAVFVIDPLEIPAELHLPMQGVRPLGIFLLVIVAAYVSVGAIWKKPIAVFGHHFLLPGFRLSVLQVAIAAADLCVAAAVLFCLLPPNLEISFAKFMGVYLLGVVAVLFTHVPGGLGVFELVMLTLLPSETPQHVVVSLLVFRVVYYGAPLLVAAVLFGAFELWTALNKAGRASSRVLSKSHSRDAELSLRTQAGQSHGRSKTDGQGRSGKLHP